MIIEIYENIIDLCGLRGKSIYLIALRLCAIYLASSGERQLVAVA